MTEGELIKAVRTRLGLSQQKFARKCTLHFIPLIVGRMVGLHQQIWCVCCLLTSCEKMELMKNG